MRNYEESQKAAVVEPKQLSTDRCLKLGQEIFRRPAYLCCLRGLSCWPNPNARRRSLCEVITQDEVGEEQATNYPAIARELRCTVFKRAES